MTSTSTGAEPHRIIDKYELLERVGEGGMAVVFRARHRTLGREVALKLLHPHLSRKERNRVRFEREAMAIESLAHEHIVQIYDYSGRDSPECYIVTEFIHGVTLKGKLEEVGKLPSEVTAMIAVHLCEALHYAHSRGFIHRDIKPENVMIRDDGVVKLMDFGIARVLDQNSVTITGGLVGSPAYMSPEQASEGKVDPRSDLFSLGTLLYRCVTGRLPFSGNSPPIILRNILDGQYVDPEDPEPGIAPELSDIIRKSLATEPERRYQDAETLRLDLERFLAASEVAYGPEEIKRYLDSPSEYVSWLEAHLGRVLAKRGKELIKQGDRVAALKLFNRALYLDDGNQEVLDLLQELHQSKGPRARHILAAMFVVIVPLAAFLALGLQNLFVDNHNRHVAALQDATPSPPHETVAVSISVPGSPTAEPPRSDTTTPTPPQAPTPLPKPVRRATPANRPGSDDLARVATRPAPGTKPRRATRTKPRPVVSTVSKNRPPQETKTTPRPAVVNISASPYADVYLNGKSYGNSMLRKDPITLPPGTYKLRLVNPRCEVLETDLVLKEGQILDKHYRLKPLPARVTVRNLPGEAVLYLDGERLGRFEELGQPILVQKPRRGHVLKAVLPDGEERTWRIPRLSYNGTYTIDASGEDM